MKRLPIVALALASAAFAQSPLTLWYRQPAKLWVEALPVGNGRLGAMIFGGIAHERIQFNEQTVWTGEPHDYAHPGAAQSLGRIRELLWAGKQKEAEDLATQEFMSVPIRQRAYQSFGDLELEFPGPGGSEAGNKAGSEAEGEAEGEVTGYRRDLNLDTAISSVIYSLKGVEYRRVVFASYPANVIVVRLTANRPGSLTFTASMKSSHAATVKSLPDGSLALEGRVNDSAIRFQARLAAEIQGGSHESKDGKLIVVNADSVTLILAGATNFKNFRDVSADPAARNTATLDAVRRKTYDALLTEHLADYQKLFQRVSLDLGTSPAAALPTDERVAAFAKGNDPALVALVFQYGRYLTIGSSRPGGQPANLQGLWNESDNPPWDSKYTDNINTEMNYWPVEETNLSECQLPLFDALKDLAQTGAVVAREHYNARGWVVHHNFDLWRGAAPINASNHGIWQTGGAWLSTHLWEHYLFTGDKQFLRDTAYPLMKGAALFFVDSLVKDPKSGLLYTGPSNSPEQGGLVMGPAMDREIVRSLFGETIAASRILDTDAALRGQLTNLRAQIAPSRVGQYGQLQEWMEDKDDPKNEHRHVSHLWAVYPGAEITPYGTPELFKAARQSLIYRGDAATGWSMGWKINLWARFLDGDHADKILQNLIQPANDSSPGHPGHAGLFANLFDAHPPFQIDGNFGATAGIAEMLLQSDDPHGTATSLTPAQTGEAAFLTLLPALPAALPSGKVTGLRARGGVGVDIEWRDGKLVKARLTPAATKPIRIRYAGQESELAGKAGVPIEFNGKAL
jgi:alpha-L-fucosidase 2